MSAPSEDAPGVGPAGEEQGPGGHCQARPLHHQQERAEVDVESEIRKSMCCSAGDVFQLSTEAINQEQNSSIRSKIKCSKMLNFRNHFIHNPISKVHQSLQDKVIWIRREEFTF